jgi:hypothetical protein
MSVQPESNNEEEEQWWLASNMDQHPLDVGVVFDGLADNNNSNNKCGHRLALSPLTQYLDGTHATRRGSTCPVCQTPVVLVADGASLNTTTTSNNKVVFFKYGKQYFRLTVAPNARSWFFFTQKSLAQERIANVFQMKGLKIICKGKVIFPDPTRTNEAISQRLIELSTTAKASLVVMGTRVGRELQDHRVGLFSYLFHTAFHIVYGSLSWMYQLVFRPTLPPPTHRD